MIGPVKGIEKQVIWQKYSKATYLKKVLYLGYTVKKIQLENRHKTCIWIYIAALFVTLPDCKQPKEPSKGELINPVTSMQWNTFP